MDINFTGTATGQDEDRTQATRSILILQKIMIRRVLLTAGRVFISRTPLPSVSESALKSLHYHTTRRTAHCFFPGGLLFIACSRRPPRRFSFVARCTWPVQTWAFHPIELAALPPRRSTPYWTPSPPPRPFSISVSICSPVNARCAGTSRRGRIQFCRPRSSTPS